MRAAPKEYSQPDRRDWLVVGNSSKREKETMANIEHRLSSILDTARSIMADEAFTDLLASEGVTTAPRTLSSSYTRNNQSVVITPLGKSYGQIVLEFAIARAYFLSLLANARIAWQLGHRWGEVLVESNAAFQALSSCDPFLNVHRRRGRRSLMPSALPD